MNAHTGASASATPSWLSLIAEAAGVEASQVARIELRGQAVGPQSVIVQIVAQSGRVLGAERWEGRAEDLKHGVRVDLGVWMTPEDAREARAIAFIDPTGGRAEPSRLRSPTGSRGRRISRGLRTRIELERAVSEHAA